MNSGKIVAGGWTGGRETSKVLQEVLADLKTNTITILTITKTITKMGFGHRNVALHCAFTAPAAARLAVLYLGEQSR